MSPPVSSPVAKASDRVAVREALKDHVRPCWYMNEAVETGTSATGARSSLMPAHKRTVPVFVPWVWVVGALPRLPIWGADTVGGAQLTRLPEPPAWSLAIRRGGRPP